MFRDHQGLAVTTTSSTAIAAMAQFVQQSLCYGNQAEYWIQAAIAADPEWGLAHACAAAYYLSQETAFHHTQAQSYLQRASTLLPQGNPREKLYIDATIAWGQGDIGAAIAAHEAIAAFYPQDLLSVQQGQYHYFYQGDNYGLLRIAQKVLPVHPHNGYLLGMLAFGLEQCKELGAAEAVGREAIALNPQDYWAQHAVAHVLETQGQIGEGITWLEGFSQSWQHCNSMLYTHNWWHLALFYLANGDDEKALELYDSQVWGKATQSSPKDQVGAISLLLRLELALKDRSEGRSRLKERWQHVAPYLLPRIHEHLLPFQDLHYVYALARAGDRNWLGEMLDSMTVHAHRLAPPRQQVWLNIVLPAAHGLVAHAIADLQAAVNQLQPVLAQFQQVGGSHTQRKLFEQIYQDALANLEQAPLRTGSGSSILFSATRLVSYLNQVA